MMFSRWYQVFRQALDDPRFRENRRVRMGIYIGLGVLMYLLLLGSILPPRYEFKIGQTSPVTIVSPITTVDTAATEAAKESAMDKVPNQYVQSLDVETNALNAVDSLFATATQVVPDKKLTTTQKLDSLT